MNWKIDRRTLPECNGNTKVSHGTSKRLEGQSLKKESKERKCIRK